MNSSLLTLLYDRLALRAEEPKRFFFPSPEFTPPPANVPLKRAIALACALRRPENQLTEAYSWAARLGAEINAFDNGKYGINSRSPFSDMIIEANIYTRFLGWPSLMLDKSSYSELYFYPLQECLSPHTGAYLLLFGLLDELDQMTKNEASMWLSARPDMIPLVATHLPHCFD